MIHRISQMLTCGLSVFLLANAAVVTNAAAEPAHDARFWWPERLDLSPLREAPASANPYGADFDYRTAFQSLDLVGVKADIKTVLTTSQPWWPADYGNYGPFFIRMAWHSAGTYRVQDGRGGGDGGQQRFEPLNSWPDNANLDKARRLLWPVKQKYGRNLSWGDLMVLAGNVAMESMGFPTYGFAGGRADDWTPDTVYWGASKFMDSNRDKDGKLSGPVAAVQMGLIYVNPEGPNRNHDPVSAAKDIREAFGRMAMNDEETVALIAGGHTFGKAHGAHPPKECTGPEPAAESVEKQGFGWHNKCGKGNGADTVTSGLEGAWTSDPVKFTSQYLDNLLNLEWVKTESPAGATQWKPKDGQAPTTPDAHDPAKTRPLMMLTTDIALKEDPAYRKVVETFAKDPEAYKKAFGKAWFKLTHRDMGPRARYLGADVPNESFPWQDPVPALEAKVPDAQAIKELKSAILKAGIDQADLIRAAWASAASYRETDHRGGTNGARVRLEPQKNWKVNDPESLAKTLAKLETVREEFNKGRKDNVRISMADIIVLGGTAAAEAAAKKAGISFIEFPFTPGRADALQTQTDSASFAVLEPKADAFRNYFTEEAGLNPGEAMVERAAMLNLTVPEMTALIGGLRVLNANAGGSSVGVLTKTPGTLDNAFFVNLLDMKCEWKKSDKEEGLYEAFDRATGKQVWKATTADLLLGSHSELRAVAEAYASEDGKEQFVKDFAKAWGKVMNLGRYDL